MACLVLAGAQKEIDFKNEKDTIEHTYILPYCWHWNMNTKENPIYWNRTSVKKNVLINSYAFLNKVSEVHEGCPSSSSIFLLWKLNAGYID